jgi:hypothetical protein
LTYCEGDKVVVPNLAPARCILGTCNQCGVNDNLGLNQCPVFTQYTGLTNCLTWKKAHRRGENNSGKSRTQLEPTTTVFPFNELIDSLTVELEDGKIHFWLGKVRTTMQNIDISESKNNVLVISTDFGSHLNYRAKHTDNSSEDNHGVADIFIVSYNQHDEERIHGYDNRGNYWL